MNKLLLALLFFLAFALGFYSDSEAHYRDLLALSPENHAARNNLAYALAEQGQLSEAIGEIEFILGAIADDDPFREEYEDSWSDLARRLPVKVSLSPPGR